MTAPLKPRSQSVARTGVPGSGVFSGPRVSRDTPKKEKHPTDGEDCKNR